MSKGLMMMIAHIMPREHILEVLDEAIQEYKLSPTEDNWKSITVYSVMIAMNSITHAEGIEKVMQDVEVINNITETLKGRS